MKTPRSNYCRGYLPRRDPWLEALEERLVIQDWVDQYRRTKQGREHVRAYMDLQDEWEAVLAARTNAPSTMPGQLPPGLRLPGQ